MSALADFLTRFRVRLGYPVAAVVFWFARPVPRMILAGALMGAVGLGIRGWAAGYLRKQEELAVAGPYAYTRNPLYLGSAVLLVGLALAASSWISAALAVAYFAVFYSAVMRREEADLRQKFGPVFEEYARAVPLFFPRWSAFRAETANGVFSWRQYWRNREYRAALGCLFILGLFVMIWAYRLA
jgi:protein-S-isoprenylcysteine O-methyltransferase Ste14